MQLSCSRLPVLVLLLALSAPDASAAESDTIEEIQVTATRRPTDASEISSAVTVISSDDVRIGKLTTDALAAEAGVFLQQTTPGQGVAIVRGLKGSELLHVVDGIRLNNAIFRNSPTQYLALVSPATVERIEIVRGSPTSLYGSDAVGGVLQVITRTPSFDGREMSYRGDVSVGFDTAELGKSVRASLDAGTNRVAGLLGVDYLETGNRLTGSGERIGPSDYVSKGARAALAITPKDGSRWLIDFQTVRQPNTPRVDELVPGFGQTEPSSSEFGFAPNGRDFVHIRNTHDDGLFGANWLVDLGWQRIIDDRVSRDFGSQIRTTESNKSELYGLSLSASDDIGNISWIAGAEFYHDVVASSRWDEDVVTGDKNPVQSRFPDGSSVDQASIYANLSTHVTDRQTLSGGLRYSFVEVDLAATDLSSPTNLDLDDVSADIGWSLSLSDTDHLVANLGYGFRAPNVFDLGALGERPGNRFNVPNTSLESERVTTVEFGIKHRGEKLDAQFFAWYLDYKDRLASVLTGAVTATGRDVVQTQNAERARIRGLETAINYSLTERAAIELILNYTIGEQDEIDGTTVDADRIPPFNGRLAMDLEISNDWSVEPYLVFAAHQDRLSPRDVRDSRIDPLGTAGWLTVNVAATWQPVARWTLVIGLENLLDKRYRSHGSGLDAPGQNLVLNARYSW